MLYYFGVIPLSCAVIVSHVLHYDKVCIILVFSIHSTVIIVVFFWRFKCILFESLVLFFYSTVTFFIISLIH